MPRTWIKMKMKLTKRLAAKGVRAEAFRDFVASNGGKFG